MSFLTELNHVNAREQQTVLTLIDQVRLVSHAILIFMEAAIITSQAPFMFNHVKTQCNTFCFIVVL